MNSTNQILKAEIHVHLEATITPDLCRKLANKKLNNSVIVGYTATKKLGSAVKRNKAKRLMRELVKNNLLKYGEKNFLYVLIAKKSIFDTSFENLNKEFKKLLSKK